MGFWIFMLIMNLLIPFTMIGFGTYFMKGGPEEINQAFGYRSRSSMKNMETWEFAHQYCGKFWRLWGRILLPLSVVVMLFVIGKDEDTVGTIGGILCMFQMVPLIGAIFFTERALKKEFE